MCLQYDLITSEANQPIGVDANGNPIWSNTSQYLDAQGQVIPEYARDYNTAVRANGILRQVMTDRAAAMCACPATNTCCSNGAITNCNTSSTNAHCEIDAFGNCGAGCHWCIDGP